MGCSLLLVLPPPRRKEGSRDLLAYLRLDGKDEMEGWYRSEELPLRVRKSGWMFNKRVRGTGPDAP